MTAVTDFEVAPPDAAPAARRRGLRPFTAIFGIIVCSLVMPTGGLALALGLGLMRLPYELLLVLQRLPIAFPVHMIASGLALILIPIAAFARRRPRLHRLIGRAAVCCVATGGLTALLVALASEATPTARAGLFVQGLTWVALAALAVAAIRAGNVARHAQSMLAMAAVASGAILLRLTLAAAVALALPFDLVYAVAAWACWMAPLAVSIAWSSSPRCRYFNGH